MITVTGATGHLGRLVIADLLARGVPADQVTAAVRTPEKAADLGVRVVEADYEKPETLAAAFAGADKLLLISGNEVGQRLPQHTAVIEAAKAAGVGLLAYTSILRADTTELKLAAEHRATEELIKDSGLPYVFLRNGWYSENYLRDVAGDLDRGAIAGAAADGKVALAARADFAAAAGAVLTTDGHEGQAYELAGDEAYTLAEVAAVISAESGRPLAYQDLSGEDYEKILLGAGLPAPAAEIFADCDLGIARGELLDDSGALRRLTGRPSTPFAETVRAAL